MNRLHFLRSASDFLFSSVHGTVLLLIPAVCLLAAPPVRADSISISSLPAQQSHNYTERRNGGIPFLLDSASFRASTKQPRGEPVAI